MLEKYFDENAKNAIVVALDGAQITPDPASGDLCPVDRGCYIMLTGDYMYDPAADNNNMYLKERGGMYIVMDSLSPQWRNVTDKEEYRSAYAELTQTYEPVQQTSKFIIPGIALAAVLLIALNR